jgi:hypothetical protein
MTWPAALQYPQDRTKSRPDQRFCFWSVHILLPSNMNAIEAVG